MALTNPLNWLLDPIVLGVVSFGFVAVGASMVLKDLLRDRRALATLFSRTPTAAASPPSSAVAPDPQSAVAVATATADMPAVPPPPVSRPAPAQDFPQLAQAIADVRGELAADDDGEAGSRDPSMEASWRALAPRIDRLVGDVEPVLRPVRIAILPPGEPRWALSNRAFGTYRRVNLDGESVGWLRSEITHEGQLRFRVRAHQPSLATLNAEGASPLSRLNSPELAHALSVALLPMTRYAAWIEPRPVDVRLDPTGIETILQNAMEIANGALVEARAALRRHQASEDAAAPASRYVLDVLVDGRQIALMHVEDTGTQVEIAVGVPDPHRLDLARRQTLPTERLAAYELAEAMATCAWPALAHALGGRGGARLMPSQLKM